ncbi:MAG: alpha/beta hydrolase [Aeromicrobium sp.]|nr:alpha/beta hydrolase [Aeromicrobium sp.]
MRRVARVIGWVVLAIATLVLVGPFLVPVPPLEGAVDARSLADDTSHFITVNGIDVHYRTAGSGSPVIVLMHGFGASTFSWRDVIGPLAERGTVIAFDRPAFGLTGRPMPGEWDPGAYAGGSPYAPEAQADLVVGLLDALGHERAVLVGHSAGGSVALLTALRHADRVEALVLEDAAIYTEGGPPAFIYPLLQTPQVRRIGPLVARSIGGTAGERFLESAWHDPSRITVETREGYRLPLQVRDWDRALWELTVARSPQRLGERAGEVMAPTLVITGVEDRIVPAEESERLAREIAGATLVSIEGCGHVPHEECTEEFVYAVYRFLDVLPTTGEGCLSAP